MVMLVSKDLQPVVACAESSGIPSTSAASLAERRWLAGRVRVMSACAYVPASAANIGRSRRSSIWVRGAPVRTTAYQTLVNRDLCITN